MVLAFPFILVSQIEIQPVYDIKSATFKGLWFKFLNQEYKKVISHKIQYSDNMKKHTPLHKKKLYLCEREKNNHMSRKILDMRRLKNDCKLGESSKI